MSGPVRLVPYDIYLDPLLAFQDARLREMMAYWQKKAGAGALPSRSQINPAEIVSHLPSFFMVDVTPPAFGPDDFRVRLMGTALNELFGGDFTGGTLRNDLTGEAASVLAKILGAVAQLARPMRIHGVAIFAEAGTRVSIEAGCFPLTTTGNGVDIVMGELVKRASAPV